MASNPMQRKSRISFLLGVIVTLLISGVVIAGLLLMLKQKNDQLQAEIDAKVGVYTLTQNVKKGQVLTKDMFQLRKIHKDSIPNNATRVSQVIDSWFLQTKEGDLICTNRYGELYLDRSSGTPAADTIIEVRTNNGEDFEDDFGKKVANGEYFVDINGMREKIPALESVIQDEYGMYIVDNRGKDNATLMYQETITGEYYVFEIITETLNTNTKQRTKKYVDIKNVPVLAKVDMNTNTVITAEYVVQSDEVITDDLRQEEYNMIVLPMDLMTNDYVDIRFLAPNGQNFIVVSKALVDVPMNADGSYVSDKIRVNLTEEEILAMSSAIVEAYGLEGAKIYVTKYVDPAMQEASVATYTPNAAVTAQIQADPTLVERAQQALATRYSEGAKKARNEYLQKIIETTEDYNENIADKMEEEIGNSLTTRKKYLETLGN